MGRLKCYKDELTAVINQKGVLDLDTVKGCTLGIKNNPKGCWGLCYAKKIADFRGIDFSKSVQRRIKNLKQIRDIAKLIMSKKVEFVRIGTMGEPCHYWEHTINVINFIYKCNKPIILITKHWIRASDEQLKKLGDMGVIINTSLSPLDTNGQIEYRLEQYNRYKKYGKSILRIISCEFNKDNKEGERLANIQSELFKNELVLDNPLRVGLSYPMVKQGIIKVKKVWDLDSQVYMSKFNDKTYVGRCSDCPEKCGITMN